MINIVCWKWNAYDGVPNTKKNRTYDFHHVNALYNMILRNTTVPFNFICVTDDSEGICDKIKIVPLWDEFREMGGCFTRLVCFKKDFDLFGERFISIDLDCVIVGNIDHILNRQEDFFIWAPEKSSISKRTTQYCGSLFGLKTGSHPEVYRNFNFARFRINRNGQYFGGTDQKQISNTIQEGKTIGQKEGIYNFIPDLTPKEGKLPENASILFFNGKFLPDDEGFLKHYPWMENYYPLAGTGTDRFIPHSLEDLSRIARLMAIKRRNDHCRGIRNIGKEIDYKSVNFIAYWWGNWPNINNSEDLGKKYIQRLFDGIKRNISGNIKAKYILFTDKPEEINIEGIEVRKLDVPEDLMWNLKKMFMYSHKSLLKGTTICFDLDTVITGGLTSLIDTVVESKRTIVTCKAAFKVNAIGGSIIGFTPSPEIEKLLWNPILKDKEKIENRTKGSERFYYAMVLGLNKVDFWENKVPGKVLSFKRDCKNGLPPGASVVRFHGHPRPHEAGMWNWINKYWKGDKNA